MKKYNYLLGKTKQEIQAELGDEFNFFPDTLWTYNLPAKWWQRKKMLCLYFNNDALVKVDIKPK